MKIVVRGFELSGCLVFIRLISQSKLYCHTYENWFHADYEMMILGGVTVRASDLRSSGRGFDSQSGRYQAI